MRLTIKRERESLNRLSALTLNRCRAAKVAVEKLLPEAGIKILKAPAEYVEYVSTSILAQMAALGAAIATLSEQRKRFRGTHTPTSVLGRPMGEGLIYLNYLLHGEGISPVKDFLATNYFWREARDDRLDGHDRWLRGSRNLGCRRPPAAARPRSTRFLTKSERQGCDDREADWLMRTITFVSNQLPPERRRRFMLQMFPSSPSCTLNQLRTAWDRLASELKRHGRGNAVELWKDWNKRWKHIAKWPFGLNPEQACRKGRLNEHLRRVTKPPPDGKNLGELIEEITLDNMPDLAHFSVTRTVIARPYFEAFTMFYARSMILYAIALLSEHYPWAARLRSEVEVRGLVPR